MESFFSAQNLAHPERRSLPRVAPASKVSAAVENMTRNERLGMAEVTDFSGLGLALRGLAGDPVAAPGDKLWVTLIAEEGIIPLRATLVNSRRQGHFGVKVDAISTSQQLFLLRLYQGAALATSVGGPQQVAE